MTRLFFFVTLLFPSFIIAQVNGPLCFDYTAFDAGERYMNEKSYVDFPFVNCSEDTVVIAMVLFRGERGSHVYNRPHYRDGDTIPPGARDTIRFWKRTSDHFKPGFKEDKFIVSYRGSDYIEPLNISTEIAINNGRLSVNPIELPTVARGEEIYFDVPIKNYGTDPVILRGGRNWSNMIERIDTVSFPRAILPGDTLKLRYVLKTQELLRTYKGAIAFETDEQGSYPKLYIEYYGELHSTGHPSIKFDSLVLTKFVDQHGDGNFEFWFENDGEAPLLIEYAKTSCGCLVASYSREPVAPGDRNVIKVKYDTKRIGSINKSITVKTNVGKMPVVLRVKGNVRKVD